MKNGKRNKRSAPKPFRGKPRRHHRHTTRGLNGSSRWNLSQPSYSGVSLTDRISSLLPSRKPNHLNRFRITPEAHTEIVNSVGSERSESGGILLGSRDDFVVRKYVHDPYGARSGGSYDPDIDFLNKVVTDNWESDGLAFLGFVHSHPRGVSRLSGNYGNGIGDLGYIERIMEFMPGLESFLCPIVYSSYDGKEFKLHTYIADRGAVGDYYEATIEFVPEARLSPISPPMPSPMPETGEEVETDPSIEDSLQDTEPIIDDDTDGDPEPGEEIVDPEPIFNEEEEFSEPEGDEEKIVPEPSVDAEPEVSETEQDMDDALRAKIMEEVELGFEDGSLSYAEPTTILKPVKRPVLAPENDPSVA